MKPSPLKEHTRVVLTTDRPEAHLAAGDVGCIVHSIRDGRLMKSSS